MTNLNFIYSELILAFSIMLLLIIGVFKKKSSSLVYYLSILTLLIIFIFTLGLFEKNSEGRSVVSQKLADKIIPPPPDPGTLARRSTFLDNQMSKRFQDNYVHL